MSQDYTKDCFAGTHDGKSDLAIIEDNFESLRTMFSGSTAPSDVDAMVPWFDTAKKLLKVRNTGNTAWYGVMQGSDTNKMYVYKNSAGDGWTIDSSVTDKVIAIKGGSSYYNTTAGQTAGAWQLPTKTENHRHQWYDYTGQYAHAYTWDSDGSSQILLGYQSRTGYGPVCWSNQSGHTFCDSYTDYQDMVIDLGNTWRPTAAVGTMQYIDV